MFEFFEKNRFSILLFNVDNKTVFVLNLALLEILRIGKMMDYTLFFNYLGKYNTFNNYY